MPNFRFNLKESGVGALVATALVLAGHWLRHHQLDLVDILSAVGVFILYVVCAAQLKRYGQAKIAKAE